MLDTCNVMVTVATELEVVHELLNKILRAYGECLINKPKNSTATMKLKGHWINNIKLKEKSGAINTTIIYIDFSYPKFFYENNIPLVTTEQERIEVNQELLRLIRIFGDDPTIRMDHIKYIRIDIAHQFEDIFEDYNLIFSLFYETFIKSLGKDNKRSKKYTQIEKSRDYTIGFTYEKGHNYKINVYNKTAQMKPSDYTPGKISVIRVEQMFTTKTFKRSTNMSLDKFTLKKMREHYSKFLEEHLFTYLNYVLEQKNIELNARIVRVLKTSTKTLPTEIKDMQSLILDFEMVKNIIKIADISTKDRMRWYYINWAKDSLKATEENGSVNIRFFNNFKRLEKISDNILGKKTKVTFIQNMPKIEIK